MRERPDTGARSGAITFKPAGLAIDKRKTLILLAGLAVFLGVYFSPPWSVAIDPSGKAFVLSHEGKAAIGLFLMAGIWWVFEVLPIGVTAIAIGVFQALFLIRPARRPSATSWTRRSCSSSAPSSSAWPSAARG